MVAVVAAVLAVTAVAEVHLFAVVTAAAAAVVVAVAVGIFAVEQPLPAVTAAVVPVIDYDTLEMLEVREHRHWLILPSIFLDLSSAAMLRIHQ